MNYAIYKILSVPYLASVLSWITFGLVAGVVAKLILPGQENLGWLKTIIMGVIGAFVGGMAASMMGYHIKMGWNVWGFICAVLGSVILLLLNRIVTKS